MASVTETKGSAMSDEDRRDEDEKKPEKLPYKQPSTPAGGEGFFHIYKPGHGYWTRMLTAAGAGLFICGTAAWIYEQLSTLALFQVKDVNGVTTARTPLIAGIVAGFCAAAALLSFYLINKPTNAEFLIATDSEMKKVNWTSWHELMGSTKVVILFMFLIAFMLFGFDIFFGYLFKWITVLKHGPFD